MKNKTITLSKEEVDLLVWAMGEFKLSSTNFQEEANDLHKRLIKIQNFMFPPKKEGTTQ
jgi:hypothetical protein